MNELQSRVNKITNILSGEWPKPAKVLSSLQTLSGMDITNLNQKKVNAIHKHLFLINKITSSYPAIVTENNYNSVSDKHLNEMLKNIQQLCLKLLID